MSQQRWRRLLPDRSQLWVLVAALVIVFAGVSFYDVASVRSRALANQRAVQAQRDSVAAQNERLRAAKALAENGQDLELRAKEYFNYARPDEMLVVTESQPAPLPLPPAEPETAGGIRAWIERIISSALP